MDVLVSFDADDADTNGVATVTGTVRGLPPSDLRPATDRFGNGGPGMRFSGWLELLGHLERLALATQPARDSS